MENQIFQDLKGLHLSGMAECWQNLQETRKHQEIVLQDGLVMLIQAEHDQRAANKTARLIKNARFRKQVTPGDVLTLHCELVEQRGPVGIGKASAYVDGKCAATAELTFVLTEANTGA